MNLLSLLALLIHFSSHFYGHCITNNIHLGSETTLDVPMLYITGLVEKAFILETSQPTPNFQAALIVEATEDKYVCSFVLFLGNVKVWSSSHLSRFFTSGKCMFTLSRDGDLQLTGQNGEIGWRTATYGQGIERLQLSNTGNLVLLDEFNTIKWQSFHFPTDVMLWGQTLDVGTKLTSFPTNSNSFYSFEIHREKLALYLNSGNFKYSYWEFNPTKPQKISFIRLALNGLQLFNDDNHKIGQIPSKRLQRLRFLAIDNTTGNLGFYYYSSTTTKFETSFQSLRNKCDQPNLCKANDICTLSKECSRLEIEGFSGNFCGNRRVDMQEIRSAISILKDENKKMVNMTRETCVGSCMDDCTCVGALFTSGNNECYLYEEVRGVKEVDDDEKVSTFMVKVLKKGSNGLKRWALILIVVSDGLILFICLGGLCFYMLRKRR